MAGESIFLNNPYQAGNDNSEIAFGSSVSGKILPITRRDGECIIIQKTAFLAAEDSVTLATIPSVKCLGAGLAEKVLSTKPIGPNRLSRN